MRLSKLAENLASLSISNFSEKIEGKKSTDKNIFNFTIGDFSPQNFPIPQALEKEIIRAYEEKLTNYSPVGGMRELRCTVSEHLKSYGQFNYSPDEIIVASGTRPLIYLLFKTLVDPDEKIVHTVPSWNMQNFIYLAEAKLVTIVTQPENNFLITAEELEPYIKDIALINLNSPLNPTGSIFSKEQLEQIMDLISIENKIRIKNNRKPIYILFDIIYWLLVYDDKFANFSSLMNDPAIKNYIIFVDGISKCFAATGVRIGWAFGPKDIIEKMRSMLAHLGAWAPKPEQIAVARYLKQQADVNNFLTNFKCALLTRLNIFYETIRELKNLGYKVDAIEPQGAIYLAIKIDIIGCLTKTKQVIKDVDDIMYYLLEEANIAIVPFYLFGMEKSLPWFRLSVGTCNLDEAEFAASALRLAIMRLGIN